VAKTERDSRASIAEAALVEFAEYGFDGARIARIAARARVNKQLLYYYFGSKSSLHQSVVRDIAREFTHLIRSRLNTDNPVERIRARSGIAFDYLASNSTRTRLLLSGLSDEREETEPIRGAITEFQAQLHREISAAQGGGFFRDDVDPARAAAQTVILLLGYFSLNPLLDQTGSQTTPADWIQSTGDLLARSLSW
jgi:AcrR family transcriptional regulator